MTNPVFTYNDKLYSILNWAVRIVLPAFATLYFALAGVWGLPNPDAVVATITAIVTFLGVTLGISAYNYNKDGSALNKGPTDGVINVESQDNGSILFDMVLDKDPEILKDKSKVVFEVKQK